MKFVSVRDLRLKPGEVWKMARQGEDLVLTSNGRPVAIMTGVNEQTLSEELEAIQRARALRALDRLQQDSVKKGTSKLTGKEIQQEIAAVRRGRKG